MKIEIEKKDLISLIGKTLNIVEKRNAMPILANVLLEADQNRLKIFATDLEVSLTDSVPIKLTQSGKIALSAKNLFDFIKELSDGPIQLNKKDNNWIEVKQGKFNSKIIGISADEYPIFPAYNGSLSIKVQSDVLKEMIDKTIFSVSNDETRYHLNGVYFEQKEGDYIMVATDGHRLSLIKRNLPASKTFLNNGVIIPRKGLQEIKKLIELLGGEFEIAIDGAQLIVRHEPTTLMIRLIEGKYPNYLQFIPQQLSQKLTVNKDELIQSLKVVSPMANPKSKVVSLQLTNGRMEITSNNPEMGDARAELDIQYVGKDTKICFNAKYIQDVLQTIQADKIEIEFNDNLSPGLLRPFNDQNYTCVVMPMRI